MTREEATQLINDALADLSRAGFDLVTEDEGDTFSFIDADDETVQWIIADLVADRIPKEAK